MLRYRVDVAAPYLAVLPVLRSIECTHEELG